MRRASDLLRNKLKEFEGFKLKAYLCPAGVWTIGVGHTRGVKKGQVITAQQAEQLLTGDLLSCEQYVNSLPVVLTQGQFDALVDFCFNFGVPKLIKSTLLKKVLSGDKQGVIAEFGKWVYADGNKLNGLVTRRAWEAQRYEDNEI